MFALRVEMREWQLCGVWPSLFTPSVSRLGLPEVTVPESHLGAFWKDEVVGDNDCVSMRRCALSSSEWAPMSPPSSSIN